MFKKLIIVLALTAIVGACQNYGPDGSVQGFYDRCVGEGTNAAGCAFGAFGYSFTYLFTDEPVE